MSIARVDLSDEEWALVVGATKEGPRLSLQGRPDGAERRLFVYCAEVLSDVACRMDPARKPQLTFEKDCIALSCVNAFASDCGNEEWRNVSSDD